MWPLILTIVTHLLKKRGKANDTNMGKGPKGPKEKMAPLKKLRLYLIVPLLITFICALLAILMVFAGSKPGMMEDYAVFTLNTSRTGQGWHQSINREIDSWNVDDLHIDLVKRSLPNALPTTLTAPPTTLITMAPRDVKSVFESLTEKAGDNIESANSAAHSKASEVKSKASSAANSLADSVESSVNDGLDKAAAKIKGKVTELVDDGFEKIRSELNLQGFYSVYMGTTCQGTYVKGTREDAKLQPRITKCDKKSALNPMKWVQLFYWASFILTVIAFCAELKVIHKPEKKWLQWTMFFQAGGAFMIAIGSALSHGIANNAQRLADFLGSGLSIDGKAGTQFIAMTWATTILLIVNIGVVFFFKCYTGRHPDATSKESASSGFGGFSGGRRPKISRPMPQSGGSGYGDGSIGMQPPRGDADRRQPPFRPTRSHEDRSSDVATMFAQQQASGGYAAGGYGQSAGIAPPLPLHSKPQYRG